MKKKLITGVGIITLIFVVSGIFIFANLRLVTSTEQLRDSQDKVLDSYSDIMFYLRSAQAELYRHEAGYSRDIDGLAENVLRIEDALSAIKMGYGGMHAASCNNCHATGPKVAALQMRLDRASDHLRKYEEKISLIATTSDIKLVESWENEATEEGNRLLDIVTGAAEATARMNRHLDRLQISSLKRSGITIFAAIILSSLFSLAVIALLMRSIRRPLNMLVEGIERVSSGNYSSRVDVTSDAEIGFLAKTFNTMTGSLETTTRQRDLLEDELRQLNANLEKRVSKATEDLKRSHEQMLRTETLSAVGTLASGVAHELATPLSSVINYVQMIRRRTGDQDRISGEMSIIEKELARCRDILRGMLAFIRPPEKERMLTDINGILHDMIELTKYQTRSNKIYVRESLDPRLPSIMAVQGQLKQVFLNIIVNAIQSMPEGGELEVATSPDDEAQKIEVKISDTGSGIPSSNMNRIFEPFFTDKKSGTGLGLSISYGIVKGHGGDIEVYSEEGKGTTFLIRLPVSTVGVTEGPEGESPVTGRQMFQMSPDRKQKG
jgi:signal transduction histidine kinase